MNKYKDLLSDSEYEEIQSLRKNAMAYYYNEFQRDSESFQKYYENGEPGMFEVAIQRIQQDLEEFNAWSVGNLPHCVEFIRNKNDHLIRYEQIQNWDKK